MRKVVAVAHGEHQGSGSLSLPHGLVALSCHKPYTGAPAAHPDDVRAVWMLWLDDDDDALTAANTVIQAPLTAYLVDERIQWDRVGDSTGRTTPGVKQISFIRRTPDLPRAQFASHWTDVHAPLARVHHPAIRRYVQNVVVEALTPDAPDIDGIAELHFGTYDDLVTRMYDSDEGRAVVKADVRRFIDAPAGWRMVGTEHVYLRR
jgi:uncharacterized protein (TIGR02118 family)